MPNPLWSKTTLAQAVSLAVAGTATAAANATEPMSSVTVTSYDLTLRSDAFASYSTYNASLDEDSAHSLKVVVPTTNNWDMGVTLSRTLASGSSTPKYTANTTAKIKADYESIDFEAGYNSNLGPLKTRVSGGLRYIDLNQDNSSSYQYATGPTSILSGTKYTGEHHLKALGVRVAGEANMPIAAGLSVSGNLGAAMLYGKRSSDYSSKYANEGSETSYDEIYGMDSEIVLNYDLSPKTAGGATVSLGYTYSKMYNLLRTDIFEGDGALSDLEQHGWFVRLNSTF